MAKLVLLHGNTRCYPRLRHPDANAFRPQAERLSDTGYRGLYEHHLVKIPYLQVWNDSRGKAHAISHDNLDYPIRRSWTYFMTSTCIHTTTR